METRMSRRRFFRLAGALGALAAAPGSLLAQPRYTPAPDSGTGSRVYHFFTLGEAAFVTAAVDRLIPADEQWPSASQAGVVDYIDLQLAGAYGNGSRLYLQGPWRPGRPTQGYQLPLTPAELYRIAIAAIDGSVREAYQGSAFDTLSAEEQDKILSALETGRFPLEELPSAVFFETLLANTVEGFFADPIYGGNRDMAGWRMVGFPGAYAQYYHEVENHGGTFDRPPVSIASGRS